jgi:hypothetical protein
MKVKPIVDVIEEKLSGGTSNQLEAMRTSKDLENQEDNRVGSPDKDSSPNKQIYHHSSFSRAAANRSRNHLNNSRSGL